MAAISAPRHWRCIYGPSRKVKSSAYLTTNSPSSSYFSIPRSVIFFPICFLLLFIYFLLLLFVLCLLFFFLLPLLLLQILLSPSFHCFLCPALLLKWKWIKWQNEDQIQLQATNVSRLSPKIDLWNLLNKDKSRQHVPTVTDKIDILTWQKFWLMTFKSRYI